MTTSGTRWRGLIPPGVVALAAVAWAFIPVLILQLGSAGFAVAIWATLLINVAKSGSALPLVLLRPGLLAVQLAAAREVLVQPVLRRLMVVDGVSMAASNLLFVLALGQGNGAIVTLVLNSWPVATSFFLARFLPRFRRVPFSRIAGAALALLGILAIVFAGNGAGRGGLPPLAIVFAVIGAAGQGIVVVIHQRFLARMGAAGPRNQVLWQSMRSGFAAAATLLVAVPTLFVAGVEELGPVGSAVLPLLLAGVLWTASGVLFHYAMARSENAFATVPWLLAPLLSASLVSLLQGDAIPRSAVLGGVIVLAANAILSLTIEPPRNVAIMVLTIVMVAIAVFTIQGRGIPEFYSIAQTLGTFFAISFGFLVARLHEQRNAARLLDIRLSEQLRMDPSLAAAVAADTPPDGLDSLNADQRARIADLRADRRTSGFLVQSLLPISEAMVVTLLGLGACVILTFGRPAEPVSDLVAFLVVSAVLFSILSLWTGLRRSADVAEESSVGTDPAQVGEAVFGYVSVLIAYAGITLAILLGSADWPSI